MPDEFRADAALELLYSDLETLAELLVIHGQPPSEGQIRAATPAMRRWLVEGLLGRLCHAISVKATVKVIDNRQNISMVSSDPSIEYYLTGGVLFKRNLLANIYESTKSLSDGLRIRGSDVALMEVGIPEFVRQKRIYHNGVFYSNETIVKWVSNKLGGVHLDFNRQEGAAIDSAASYMTFGGPLHQLANEPHGRLHLAVDPKGREALSGFHIEIVAAAASLIGVHFDGEPIMAIQRSRTLGATLRRLFRLKSGFRPSLHEASPKSD